MALWPTVGRSQIGTTGNTGTSASSVSVTGSATPHAMGSWTTLVASTPFRVDGISLFSFGTSGAGADTSVLIDVGIGAAASERVLVATVPIGFMPIGARAFFLPIQVPAGERIAVRLQSAVASKAVTVGMVLTGDGDWVRMPGTAIADVYGAVTGSSSGTTLSDTGSANTKAAWTEITSSTSRRYRCLLPIPSLIPADTSITTSDYLYDVGIGASGSEVSIMSDMPAVSNAQEDIRMPTLQPLWRGIPAGTRLSARMQKSVSGAEPLSMALIGFD